MNYYKQELKENKAINQKLLTKFESYLKSMNFPEGIISKMVFDATFYIYIYLTKDRIIPAVEGYKEIKKFPEFFLKEATWSLLSDLQAGMNSVKLFYECLYKLKYIKKEDYQDVAKFVDEDIPDFIEKYQNNDDLLLRDYVIN